MSVNTSSSTPLPHTSPVEEEKELDRSLQSAMAAAHVLVLPYPSQGHINPMLEFAKMLVAKGSMTTLVTTRFLVDRSDPARFAPVALAAISDGHDEGGFPSATSLEAYLAALNDAGSRSLSDLIEERAAAGTRGAPFTCMVYDTFTPWAAEVARRHGIATAAFSTQSCTTSAVYYYVNEGRLEAPQAGGGRASAEGLPEMERWEFPSFALRDGSYATLATFALNQFNLRKDDWVLFNSFDELESKVIECLRREWRAANIGPCVPLCGATHRMNLLGSADDDTCMRWLGSNPAASTVYVSFGSFASLSVEQMTELAAGLEASGQHFLWVLRAAERKTLPPEFLQRLPERGLVVGWSPQLAVLSHPAVGCFLTHCGWNSTLEAVSLGVPMVAMAQWTDQPTNAKCVEDAWGIGVRARADEATGIVRREEIERCVRAVIESGRREEITRNSRRWKELAAKALSEGGSSDTNLDEFVAFVNKNVIE